ncbi:oxygenase MpaB family protein [Nocardia higoensis]|uniref:oxygenase MpaB family protein n=1 Tax=Nocardia higoensis TaxID=228599 RepID=UPI0009FFE436|nr:oxygenase MpaB family protein [Nocardia higoensis]
MGTKTASEITVDRSFSDRIADLAFQPTRERFFKNVQFEEPAGDPGWFGPDSAVWYLFSHTPTVQIGLAAAAMIETLHPDMAWMSVEHTRVLERKNGVPTGKFDEDALASRGGHTLSFFLGVAMGSTEVAERVSRVVRGMHDRVGGVRPDGHEYRASDPDLLAWNYVTMAWALSAIHERYHPRPMRGERLEQFFREFARMGLELGASEVPTTRAGVYKYLEDSIPMLGVTMPTVDLLNPLAPWRHPVYQRPVYALLYWAVQDLHPDWAQRLMNTPQYSRPKKAVLRAITRLLLQSVRDGKIREVRQAHARAAATPAAPALAAVGEAKASKAKRNGAVVAS